MKVLIFILISLVAIDATRINFKFFNDYLYQTSITVGNSSKKFNVLLDFTSTQLWFFATTTKSNASTPFLQLSTLPNFNVSKQFSTLKYSSRNGVDDYDFSLKAYSAGNASLGFDGNKTINSSSFGIVYADNYSLPTNTASSVLGVGIIGIGSLVTSNLTNYFSQLLNSTGKFVLCTRPSVSQAVLIINEPFFNSSILEKAVATKYSPTPKNSGSFQFNITTIKLGVGFYLEKTVSAVISTLTNFLTVDKTTWSYIKKQFRPAYDNKTGDYFINCKKIRQMRVNFSVQNANNNTNNWLMIPGTDLVEATKHGYCQLKVRPSTDSTWVLGGPFLRHHCVQVELATKTLTFVNNTIFSPGRKHIY